MKTMQYTIIALVFVILVSSSEFVLDKYRNSLLNELRMTEQSQLSSRALVLQSVIDRNFNLMVSLEAYVSSNYLQNKDDQEVLNYIASLYLGAQASTLNLLIAPKGIVKAVFPLKGNESIMNWDLLNDSRPNVQQQIVNALTTKRMTMDGPFKLLQGMDGLVARKAIYQNGEFWGFVSVGVDVDQLLAEAGIKNGDPRNDRLAIRNPGQPAFFGDDAVFQERHTKANIELADHNWELGALPPTSAVESIKQQILVTRASFITILVLGLLFFLYMLRQRDTLSKAVNERTQELQLANEDLTAVNEELLAGQQELQESTKRLMESEQMLSYLAYHDVLTGIHNRTYFQMVLKEQIVYNEISHTSLAVLFFDLDNFKMVNDSHGHHMGDLMLREVVNRIQQSELPFHTFARFGGDEFAILLEDCADEQDVRDFCEQLIEILKPSCLLSGRAFFISASIGIVQYPYGGLTWESLLKNADIAMYMAKKESGSSYSFFDKQMAMNSVSKLEMGNHLRQSMDRNELEIVYQPQIDCHLGKVIGVEALLRWNHTTKGYISPSEFIPIAEEMGFIVTIGEWVMRGACMQMKAWHNILQEPLTISVNLSVKQLNDERFVDKVIQILEETGLEAKYLEIEITENVAMRDDQLEALGRLRKLGIAISVDDFGTHYSSLSYLKRFPVTKIKLDQSFVRGVHNDDKDRAMIKAIISVAKSFQLQIIAEGVETEEQARFLVANGCSQIQGYYFFRPMPADQTQVILQMSMQPKLGFMNAI
ncbi:bifunctional diguanylate cyclase/phosphodiesterase [Paenibacillus sp. CGMCC 1.16610]|uniref:EAL domain-containing protein n=1 Tax=Paenibacillus anseongense TaxID=2682845 RepID=A0ABW9UMG4_9BACL|nr:MULTISPECIES: EAL domain-containing protein [Paenibacillus]MBA2943468.1 bifunctional diguanylate cyclase/phosphodiesterase [Paenibacillus sp. CGMCC 1.16610]MVQ40447.1 EAL domain-containing protein [Paenibacillus anseongense]